MPGYKEVFFEAISHLPIRSMGIRIITVNISIDGLDAEAAFLCLGEKYSFSNGSACNSSSHALSYVLEAMRLDEKRRAEAIRLSWSGNDSIDFSDFVSIIDSIL